MSELPDEPEFEIIVGHCEIRNSDSQSVDDIELRACVEDVLFNADLLRDVLKFSASCVSLGATCQILRELTGRIGNFSLSPANTTRYLEDPIFRIVVRRRLTGSDRAERLGVRLSVPDGTTALPFSWKPNYGLLLNEVRINSVAVGWQAVHHVPLSEFGSPVTRLTIDSGYALVDTSVVPEFLAHTPRLKYLKLYGRTVDLRPLRNLADLEELDIVNCKLTSPQAGSVGDFANLHTLRVLVHERFDNGNIYQGNHLLGQQQKVKMGPLGSLPGLRVLHLSACLLDEANCEPFFAQLVGLQELVISAQSLDYLRFFTRSQGLKKLDFSRKSRDVPVHGGAPLGLLTNFPKLESLRLSGWSSVGNFSALRDLTSLKEVNLDDTGFSDLSVLQDLPELELLSCENTQVATLVPLTKFKALKDLKISGPKLKHYDALFGLKSPLVVDAPIFSVKRFVVTRP